MFRTMKNRGWNCFKFKISLGLSKNYIAQLSKASTHISRENRLFAVLFQPLKVLFDLFSKELAGMRASVFHDLRNRPRRDHLPALLSPLSTKVQDMVRGLDHI